MFITQSNQTRFHWEFHFFFLVHASFVSDPSNVTEACRLSVLLRDYNMYVIKLKDQIRIGIKRIFFPQKGFTANGEWFFSGFNSGWWCFLFPGAGAVWSDWLCTLLNFSSVYKHAELNYTIKGSSCGWLALRYRISRIHWHKAHKAETSFLLNLKQNSFDMLLPFMCKLKRVKNVLNGLGAIVWTLEQKWKLSSHSVARRCKSLYNEK